MARNENIFAIDLATTKSEIATVDRNGIPVVIENPTDGDNSLDSVVYFPEGASPVVGKMAKEMRIDDPERVVEYVKRYMGEPDPPTWTFDGITYDPITISALILKRMKTYAEEQGNSVDQVVITCPAHFNNEAKAATRQAGEIAGLKVLDIIHEPTAAAVYYTRNTYQMSGRIMVFDLGGGTFDVTVFDYTRGSSGEPIVNVIKAAGCVLGGVDWDQRMQEYMEELVATQTGIRESDLDDISRASISAQVEQAKKDMTHLERKIYTVGSTAGRTRIEVTRNEFEARTQDLVDQCMEFVRQLLKDVQLTSADIDQVLLVGGSTLMPMIGTSVRAMFPGDKVHLEDPHLAVVKGAALYAEDLRKRRGNETGVGCIVRDRITQSLGPAIYYTDPQTDIERYVVDNLLFVGDKIPAEAEATYGTRAENQKEIILNVYENVAEDRVNHHVTPCYDHDGNPQRTDPALRVRHIGEVHLQLPPNTPQGTPIHVVFRADTMGLNVSATNMVTGEAATTVIESDVLYSEEDLKATRNLFQSIAVNGTI